MGRRCPRAAWTLASDYLHAPAEVPAFETLGDVRQEAGRRRAVGDAMVNREGQRDDRPNRGRALARDDALAHPPHREDRGLGWVDDRGEAVDPECSEVRDSEDTTGERLGVELAGVRGALELLAVAGELREILAVRVAQYRDQQTVVEGDGDADVDGLRRDKRVVLDARAQPWVVAEGLRAGGPDRIRVGH